VRDAFISGNDETCMMCQTMIIHTSEKERERERERTGYVLCMSIRREGYHC